MLRKESSRGSRWDQRDVRRLCRTCRRSVPENACRAKPDTRPPPAEGCPRRPRESTNGVYPSNGTLAASSAIDTCPGWVLRSSPQRVQIRCSHPKGGPTRQTATSRTENKTVPLGPALRAPSSSAPRGLFPHKSLADSADAAGQRTGASARATRRDARHHGHSFVQYPNPTSCRQGIAFRKASLWPACNSHTSVRSTLCQDLIE